MTFKKGHKGSFYWKGKHLSEEHKIKISKVLKGHGVSEEHRRIISETHKGKPLSTETRRKISEGHKGKHLSEEHKKKLSLSRQTRSGENAPMYGKHHSEEARRKMSLAQSGENNHCWCGGKSFEPYGLEFNDELKKQIRNRDNYQCQLCGVYQEEISRSLDIHHIDYCKTNNDSQNLISLCTSCHSKMQGNHDELEACLNGVMTSLPSPILSLV